MAFFCDLALRHIGNLLGKNKPQTRSFIGLSSDLLRTLVGKIRTRSEESPSQYKTWYEIGSMKK